MHASGIFNPRPRGRGDSGMKEMTPAPGEPPGFRASSGRVKVGLGWALCDRLWVGKGWAGEDTVQRGSEVEESLRGVPRTGPG